MFAALEEAFELDPLHLDRVSESFAEHTTPPTNPEAVDDFYEPLHDFMRALRAAGWSPPATTQADAGR